MTFARNYSRSPRAGFLFICLIILVQTFFLCSTAYATYAVSIHGSVSDTSGLPLTDAHITVVEQQTGAISGWDGNYRIFDLPPGRYTLVFSHLGYLDGISENIIVHEGIPTIVNLTMVPHRLTRPVARVRTARHDIISSYNQNVTITCDNWHTTGAKKVGDVLRSVPGVNVLEGDGSQRLSLRGSPSRTVQVDLDGIPLNEAGTGEAEVGHIDLDLIDAIQVEFEGIGGKVHLQTTAFAPADRLSHNLTASAAHGGCKRNELGLSTGRRYSRFSGSAIYKRKTNDGDFKYKLDDGTVHRRINNKSRSSSFIAGIGYSKAAKHFEAGAYYENSRRGIPGLIYAPPTPEAALSSDRMSARLTQRGASGIADWSVTGYVSNYSSRFTSPAEQYNPSSGTIITHVHEDNRQTGLRYGLTSNSTLSLNSSRLRFGYTHRRDYYKGKDLYRNRVTIGGVGLGTADRMLNRFDLGGQLWGRSRLLNYHISPGIAAELIDDEGHKSYHNISPSLYVGAEKPFNLCSLKLTTGWGRSLSTPPFNALFLVENSFAVGNKNLKPEQGESLSYGLGLSSVSGSEFHWTIDVLRTVRITRDLIIWQRNFHGKYYPDNVDRVKARSVELNASTSLFERGLSLSGGYVFNNSVNDMPGDINYGRMTPLVPLQSGSASVVIRIWDTSLHLGGRWVGRRYSTESNQDPLSTAGMGLPPYEVYDLNISREFRIKLTSIVTEVGIDNLLDESYRVIERSPMPGRMVGGKVNFVLY